MPMYEYACRACGGTFEERRAYVERLAPLPCPACGGEKTSLKMSVPAMVGGGSGGEAAADSCGMGGGSCCGGVCMN